MAKAAKIRLLVGLSGPLFSYSPGEEIEVGDSHPISLEGASRLIGSNAAEWAEKKKEKAIRKAPERAVKHN